MRSRDPIVLKQYKTINLPGIKFARKLKKVLKKHQLHIAKQSKKNPKVFWNYINSKHKKRSDIGDLKSYDIHGNEVFSKRQRITLRLLYAIAIPSVVCLSVCRL